RREAGVNDDGLALGQLEVQRHRLEVGPVRFVEVLGDAAVSLLAMAQDGGRASVASAPSDRQQVVLMVAAYGARAEAADAVEDGFGVGPLRHEVADEDELVAVRPLHLPQQPLELLDAAMDVTDDERACCHGSLCSLRPRALRVEQ